MDGLLQQLISFDQSLLLMLNGSDSLFLDGVMMVITSTEVWIPMFAALLYVIAKNNPPKAFGTTLVAIVLTIVVCDQVASGICKPLFQRFRPTQDPSIMYLVDIVDGYRGSRYGFISSHAANTFGLCVFLSLLFRRTGLSLLLVVWACLNSYSRIYLGVHYPGDILFGCLVGCLSGYLFHRLLSGVNRRLGLGRQGTVSALYTRTGYLVSDVNLVTGVLLLTYAVIPIIAIVAFC